MCGIIGFFDKKNQLNETEKKELIEEMIKKIDHRGKDDSGFYVDKNVAVGHTRLSILDLSKNGAQPFFNDDKTIILSYNGEIYNYRILNQELKKRHKLKSNSDTETLLYGYIDEDVDCLKNMNGMFAFSLFDQKKNKIVLAVDRFSIKPLYIINTPDWFAWSSEIKGLLLLPDFKAELNEEKLLEYFLFRQTSGEDTLFKNIKRFIPAQVLEYDIGKDEVKKAIFWRLEKKNLGAIDFEKELTERLERSVSDHLLSDVPVGIQLSGGVDSSLVVALASYHKANLNTYSIGLKDESWNEFYYSRKVAEKYKTIHHELTFNEEDFCRALPRLTYFHDEPISHSHSVPMYFLAKAARKDVKVLLSGEGADEIFFGYKRYLKLLRYPLKGREIIFSNIFNQKKTIENVLIHSAMSLDSFFYRENVVDGIGNLSLIDRVSYYDLQTYLPPLLLRQDKMGMAANLENRVPFLNYELVEFGFSLPQDLKINNEENKVLLKQVARKFFPVELVDRKKCGFGQPLANWFRNKNGLGVYLKFFNKDNENRSFLNYEGIRNLIEKHVINKEDNAEILWTLINLELWIRIFIDKKKPEDIVTELYE